METMSGMILYRSQDHAALKMLCDVETCRYMTCFFSQPGTAVLHAQQYKIACVTVSALHSDCWAQYHAKCHRGSREFKHPVGIEPETPDSLLLTLINEPWICVSLQKKTVYCLYCFATCDLFSFFRIVVLTLLKLNIKARNKIPEFLNANLCSKHLITSI